MSHASLEASQVFRFIDLSPRKLRNGDDCLITKLRYGERLPFSDWSTGQPSNYVIVEFTQYWPFGIERLDCIFQTCSSSQLCLLWFYWYNGIIAGLSRCILTMDSVRFGKKRFGKNMAADVAAKKSQTKNICRNVFSMICGALKSPKNVEKTERDPETILIANPTKSLRDSMAIKKEFAKYFPLKRLVYAFNTARGNIHLQFMSPEEASEVLNKWKENCFDEKTQIRKVNQPERPLRAVLIRDIPTELSEQDIFDSIEETHPDSTATRYVKKDRTPLGTVKIIFKSGQLHEKALNEGIFVDNNYYRRQKFIRTGSQILRCFKCQKFGHISRTVSLT